ncbi:uncharacterized protein LOC131932605 [Physella acuta]|uniref:uncharacterized protein LOC131932605 n=1 Tax=Physella acuta TaxID=109671 RepID=UPI0027DB4219|nr:uncharacterized protein LOC131932605 [Physella acuta]
MAAPTTDASHQATFKRLLDKETKGQVKKVTHKHMLCSDVPWPRPDDCIQKKIVSKLTEKLKSLPNIFKSPKNTPKEDLVKKSKIRSQLTIGTSCVFRALERDQLTCVLLSGEATPAIIVNHVISLCQEKGCPLVCVNQLAPSVAASTDSKCFPLAIGFKKLDNNSESDFTEIISLIREVSSTKPHAPVKTSETPAQGSNPAQSHNIRPCRVNKNDESDILEEIKRVFGSLVIQGQDVKPDIKQKRKKKKPKGNLKDCFDKQSHQQFDFGRNTVFDFLQRGKLELVLISEEMVPILQAEHAARSFLLAASQSKCPVIVVPGLVQVFRALCQGCVSVLGVKKHSNLSPDSPAHFQVLIDKCLKALASPDCTTNSGALPSAVGIEGDLQLSGDNTVQSMDTVQASGEVTQNVLASGETAQDMTPAEEDYSYLYVLKKDSLDLKDVLSKYKEEEEKTKKNLTFSSDFIQLSSSSSPAALGKVEPVRKENKTTPKQGKRKLQTTAVISNSSQAVHSAQPVAAGEFISFSSGTCDETGSQKLTSQVEDPPMFAISRAGSHDLTKSGTAPPDHSESSDTPMFAISRAGNHDLTKSGTAPPDHSESSDTPIFAISRAGSHDFKKAESHDLTKSRKAGKSVQKIDDDDAQVLGAFKAPQANPPDVPQFIYLPVSSKKNLKRKLKQEEGFISISYNEANIKTMVSNPERRRKKKKKKKN